MRHRHKAWRKGNRSLARLASTLIIAIIVVSLSACDSSDRSSLNQSAKTSGKPQKGLARADIRSGTIVMTVELAISPAEQEIGLMYRTDLPDGRGMLFVYPDDRRLAFWMKNTRIPLSIAYLDSSGLIREIYDMEPYSLAPVESERHVRYALETAKGWFNRAGLGVGDRFDLSDLP